MMQDLEILADYVERSLKSRLAVERALIFRDECASQHFLQKFVGLDPPPEFHLGVVLYERVVRVEYRVITQKDFVKLGIDSRYDAHIACDRGQLLFAEMTVHDELAGGNVDVESFRAMPSRTTVVRPMVFAFLSEVTGRQKDAELLSFQTSWAGLVMSTTWPNLSVNMRHRFMGDELGLWTVSLNLIASLEAASKRMTPWEGEP